MLLKLSQFSLSCVCWENCDSNGSHKVLIISQDAVFNVENTKKEEAIVIKLLLSYKHVQCMQQYQQISMCTPLYTKTPIAH